MNKHTHVELGKFIARTMMQNLPSKFSLAFILGSVEPDFNPVTYLRGFKTVERFRGHNYRNVAPTIEHIAFDLGYEGQFDFRTFYMLGKLAHYTADAFTFPHNANYHGTIREHIHYETELYGCFKAFLDGNPSLPTFEERSDTIFGLIAKKHEAYMQMPMRIELDIVSIFSIVCPIVEFYLNEFAFASKPMQFLAPVRMDIISQRKVALLP